MDSSLTEFARALRDAKLDPIMVEGGGSAMKLTFEPSLTFPDDLTRRHKGLMIRDFYGRLFDRVASMRRWHWKVVVDMVCHESHFQSRTGSLCGVANVQTRR